MSNHNSDQIIGSFPSLPKQARAHKKRNALVESGRELFIQKGYEHTTAKEIASHAGVATGTFYRYFSDKRQLLLSIMEDKLDNILPPEPNWNNTNPEMLLEGILAKHYEQLEQIGLYKVLPEIILHDPEIAKVIQKVRKGWHTRILEGLQRAKEKGITWEDLDLETVAWSILVILENVPKKEAESGKKMNYYDLAKTICRLVFPPNK